jgi:hypothetical protein
MRRWLVVAVVAATSACALRLGGPSPVDYTLVALDARGSSAHDAAARITEAASDFALIVAERDSAWFQQLASATSLELSGPAFAPAAGLAFVSRLPLLGDTSLVLEVTAGSVHVQDALYSVSDERFLDLMLVHLPAGTDLHEATRRLLEYMATDVMANAALVLGVSAADAAAAHQVEQLLRAAFTNAAECAGIDASDRPYRVFFGPAARVRCEAARAIDGVGIVADITVGLR